MKDITAKGNKEGTQYSTIDNSVLLDTEISHSAFRLYCIIVMLAGGNNQVCVRIKKLANLLGRSTRSIRRDLNILIEKGIIEKIRRKNTDETEEYLESLFIIHDCIRGNTSTKKYRPKDGML